MTKKSNYATIYVEKLKIVFSEKHRSCRNNKIPNLLTLTGYYESIKTTSGFVTITLGNLGDPYSWFVYDRTKKLGQVKLAGQKYSIDTKTHILVGFGYFPEAKMFNTYFWIHL